MSADHLLRIIETQPNCLMRVALNGQLLAVNQAALGLFGTESLTDVLGNSIEQWIIGPATTWRDFAEQVWMEGAGSLNCEINDLRGTARNLLLQGVVLQDHEDGIRSLLVSARDVSSLRRLEGALESQNTESVLSGLRDGLEKALADQARLQGELDQQVVERTELVQKFEEERQQLLAEQRRLQAAVEEQQARADQEAKPTPGEELEQEHQRELAALRAEIERVTAEQERVEAALSARESERRQLAADAEAARRERESALAEQKRLEALANARELENRRLMAEADTARADLDRQLTAAREEVRREIGKELESLRAQMAPLREELDQKRRERVDLDTVLAERTATLERLAAEHQALSVKLEQSKASEDEHRSRIEAANQQRDALRRDLEAMRAEQHRLQALVEAQRAECKRLTDDMDAAQAALREAIAERRAADEARQSAHGDLELEFRETIDALRGDLDRAHDEQQRLRAALAASEVEHQEAVAASVATCEELRQHVAAGQVEMEQERERAAHEIEAVRAELERAQADGQRLKAAIRSEETERRNLIERHEAALAEMRNALAEEHQLSLRLQERRARHLLEDLQRRVADSVAEHGRQWSILQEFGVGPGEPQAYQDARPGGPQPTSVRQGPVRDFAGSLSPDVGARLRRALSEAVAHARSLLTGLSLNAADRDTVEALYRETIRAELLARRAGYAKSGE